MKQKIARHCRFINQKQTREALMPIICEVTGPCLGKKLLQLTRFSVIVSHASLCPVRQINSINKQLFSRNGPSFFNRGRVEKKPLPVPLRTCFTGMQLMQEFHLCYSFKVKLFNLVQGCRSNDNGTYRVYLTSENVSFESMERGLHITWSIHLSRYLQARPIGVNQPSLYLLSFKNAKTF